MQAHEVSLGIGDAPPRIGIHVDVGLIPGRNRDRKAIPFQETFIDPVHLLNKRQLEMEPRFRRRFTLRLAELSDNDLLSLIHRVEAAENGAEQKQDSEDRNKPKTAALVHFASGLRVSGRIGRSCFIESSMMIFGPIKGRTSPMVSR